MDNAQELIQRLNHSGKKLSKSHRRIAECIVTHYDKVVFMTASKLGEYVGVSESTVVRFASALGYSGYPHLQKALQELIRHRLTASQRFEMTSDMDHAQVLNKVLKADIQNIRSTLDEMDINAFEDAIEKIIAARNIYVMGVRSSSMLAGFFCYNLHMIFDNIRLIETTAGSELFQQIMNIGPGDVMVAISFPRYSKRVIKAVEFAHNAGADVVALTDSPESPIAADASQLLIAQSDMASFVDSLVAPLSIINAIVVGVSRVKEEEVMNRLRRLEQIWDEYDVYDKNQS